MTTEMRTVFEYEKDCQCVGFTSSTGQTRMSTPRDLGEKMEVTVTFIPGPSCDGCGKPWRLKP